MEAKYIAGSICEAGNQSDKRAGDPEVPTRGTARMTREYGSLIRLGLVVPPANSTVEPELAAFLPREAAIYATRLPGTVEHETGKGLDRRIEVYVASLPTWRGRSAAWRSIPSA